ncbi:MAG: hypothetical protein ABSB01_11455 [Streptosporangiaceae bacterium]|jgi:hypothetical protein
MGGQHEAAWADAMLRRPVVDPGIPRSDRALLTAPGTLLTAAGRHRPARRRDFLPTDPGKRMATVDGAVMGMTTAMFIAVFGATPLAIGVLIFQGPAGWESASNRYALLVAEIIAVVTTVVLGVRIARFGQPSGNVPAEMAARTYHGRYLTDADFDARSRVLLRRAQDAIDAVTWSEICRAGLLDQPAASTALAWQEWDIAVALREQARLRAMRAELSAVGTGTQPACQLQAAELADSSIAGRVAALERYAAEAREADAAYRDWQQAAALAEFSGEHLDMLARTAADEHGIAELEAMSQQARAVRLALREMPS